MCVMVWGGGGGGVRHVIASSCKLNGYILQDLFECYANGRGCM